MRLNRDAAQHYREIHDLHTRKEPDASLAESVDWGIRTKRLQMSPEQQHEFHLSRMSAAMNADVTSDGARRRCCVTTRAKDDNGRAIQRTLWKLVNESPREFLVASFEQRRSGIVADVRSLRRDLDYANSTLRERGKREIQLDLDNLASDEENPEEAA